MVALQVIEPVSHIVFAWLTRTSAIAEYHFCVLKPKKKKEERYSRVPRLSDTRYYRYKQQSEIKMRHLPAVDRFKRYGR